ncbi:coiled-coil domain-containing protein 57 [Rhea pennata]|uniref:coiled-coil domain-containing protein 57 n=1 Tax=Rhea pennata TaxID=8795 RepID=UPI002E261DEE
MEKELNELPKWNEKEWKELQACKFSCQKTTLQDVRKQLQDMHKKFNKLKEDFVYNLRILEERDKELERYDIVVTHLKTSENAKKTEISDLRIQLDKLEQALVKERKKREELHYHCQQNFEDHKLELEQFCSSKNSNISHQCEDYVSLKHDMERRLQELEGELAGQKQVKLQTKELEVLKEPGMKAVASLQRAETINLKLEKEMKFKDFVAVKDARYCTNLIMIRINCLSTLHEVLNHTAKEKPPMPASAKEAQVERLQNLEKQIRELQMRHKGLEMELHRREQSHSACLREKDALVGKYKQQLALAGIGERILEQSKAQEELGWQHCCENAERKQYQKSEDLIQSLSSASKQVEADLRKTECRLHEMKTVLSAFSERDQTIQALWSHDKEEKEIFLYDDKSSLNKDFPTLEVQKLQKQNDNLRATIAQMRKEMESLDEQMLPSCLLTENQQLAEQNNAGITTENSALTPGSSCTDQVSTRSTLNKVKVSSANLDFIVKAHKEKGPENKVLQEKMVDHGQQLPNVGPSDGLPYGVGCSLQGIQNKLKEALRKILILSQEKQQLIEMGNRLRAELGMVSKEGLGHPVSSKCCTVCVAAGSLLPRDFVKRAQCQLSALEHLQYKLATQVMTYSSETHLSRLSSLNAYCSLNEEEAPSSCREEIELPSLELQCSFIIKLALRVDFEVTRTTEIPEESQQNIKAKDKAEMPATHLTVTGTRLEVQQKLKSRNLSCAHLIKPKISSNAPKIRNYNIKD